MALLKLDSWKLFLLLLIPALVGAAGLLISTYLQEDNPSLLIISQFFTFMFVGVFVSWIYSLGTCLARLTPNQSFSLSLFKLALLGATLYRVSIDSYGLWYSVSYHARLNLESNPWIFPLHLLATGAALYCFYTTARLLVSAERQRPGGVKDVWTTFGLLLAFPMGLWIIQPRLQTLWVRT